MLRSRICAAEGLVAWKTTFWFRGHTAQTARIRGVLRPGGACKVVQPIFPPKSIHLSLFIGDSTDYGRARRAPRPSHLAFHSTRRIASKAVFGDAKLIYAHITRIKALAFACAPTAARATAGPPSHAHACCSTTVGR